MEFIFRKILLISVLVASALTAQAFDKQKLSSDTVELLSVQTQILDQAYDQSKKGANWSLAAAMLDLGVSHSGRIGLLPFSGTAAATAYWARKNAKSNLLSSTTDQVHTTLTLNPNLSHKEILAQAEHLANTLMAAQKVSHPDKFKQNVRELMEAFYVVAHALAGQFHPAWKVRRLYFDRSITVGGDIFSGYISHAKLRFRVMWDLQKSSYSQLPADLQAKRDKLFPNLEKLIRNLANDLHYAASQLPQMEQTFIKTFSVGLGISESLDLLGFVQSRREGMGIIEFDYFADEDRILQPQAHKAVPIIPMGASVATPVEDDQLRAGLTHAFEMASLMFKASQQVQSPYWSIRRMDISFDIGAQGLSDISRVKSPSTSIVSFGVY